ncbi:MAG: hypothetical protein K940chlam2_01717 [Chlamydiae bacterium]|nr:hypothetical protein [Chlamydiota bacterium]
MNEVDGSWAVVFFFTTIGAAFLYIAALNLRVAWKDRVLIRNNNREIQDQYDTKTAQINSLHMTYRMMTGGSPIWAEERHQQIVHLSGWVNQEVGLLKAKGNLERILPVQDELILALESATARGRGGVAPAEFRSLVEAHR